MCQEISVHRIARIHAPVLIFSRDFDVGAATPLNSLFEKKNQMEGTSYWNISTPHTLLSVELPM